MTEPREADTNATEDDFRLSQQDLEAIGKAIDDGDSFCLRLSFFQTDLTRGFGFSQSFN